MRPRFGYGLVLLLIVGTYLLALFTERRWVVTVLLTVQTATVWQSLRVSGARPARRRAGAAVFVLALTAVVVNLLAQGRLLTALAFSAASVLYLLAPISIVRDLGRRNRVDLQTLLGALAAYLLIGMAFGFAYGLIAEIGDARFFSQIADGDQSDFLYFSFATITTTGFGDLTAVDDLGRSLAITEALIGQFYLVTVVALIVTHLAPTGRSTAR